MGCVVGGVWGGEGMGERGGRSVFLFFSSFLFFSFLSLYVRCSEYLRRQFAVVAKAPANCLASRESSALFFTVLLV